MVLIIDFNPRGPCGPRHLVYRVFSHFWNFNPRGPCGPRPAPPAICTPSWAYFNPRGPCGPRRYAVNAQFLGSDISILAVLADRDPYLPVILLGVRNFNPRGPCGPRQLLPARPDNVRTDFNPRGPCGPRR